MHSFEEFWPHYVKAHSRKATRQLHFAGTTAALTLAAAGILTRRLSLIALAPIVGYGCAWVGHFFIEGNTPATFGHPVWSLRADLLMWKMTLEGTMDDEVERVLRGDTDVPVASNDTVVN
jgi:hypothetical protein